MSRLNLLLPKSLHDFLERNSKLTCTPKAQFLRELIQNYFNHEFTQKTKPFKQNWSFSQDITFNFSIDPELYRKICLLAENVSCTKGEIIRFILSQELNKRLNKNQIANKKNNEIVLPTTNAIIQNIKLYLAQKKYETLNSYLFNFIFSDKENELLSIGQPELIIQVVNELETNISSIYPELVMFKAKMIWYLGKSDEALDVIDHIQKTFRNNKLIEMRSQILKSEILVDRGTPFDAQDILMELLKNSDFEQCNYYRVKILNKLGLSFFYTDNLEKTKFYYEQAFKLAHKDEEVAIANRYLGSIYHSTEELNLAEKHFQLSLDSFEKNKNFNLNEYSKLLITYAEVKMSEADWIEAEKYGKKALEIVERIQNVPNLAWASRILSSVYYSLGDEKKAYELVDKSMDLAKDIGGSSYLANAYRIKGKYLLMDKNFKDADKTIHNSRIFEKEVSHNSTYNTATKWINYLSFQLGKSIDFIQLHRQSDNFRKSGHSHDETTNDYVLGYLYFNSKVEEEKKKGEQILKRLLYHCIAIGDKKVQFAIEATLRFNQFTLL